MTTHAQEGIKRLLFGSVTEKVLRQVSVLTLLFHPDERILSLKGLMREDDYVSVYREV